MGNSVRNSMWYGTTQRVKESAKDRLRLSLYHDITRQLFSLTYTAVGGIQDHTYGAVTDCMTHQTGPIFSGTQGGDE